MIYYLCISYVWEITIRAKRGFRIECLLCGRDAKRFCPMRGHVFVFKHLLASHVRPTLIPAPAVDLLTDCGGA